jgi:hypothetical protein
MVSPFQMSGVARVASAVDVGMIQAGDGFCFEVEALAQLSAASLVSGKNLDYNDSIERVSRARYTLPIPPALIAERMS